MTNTLQKKRSRSASGDSSASSRDEAQHDFIEALRKMPSYEQMPTQRCSLNFPVVSVETCRIAEEAFMQFAHKYGMSNEDVGAISKALTIVFAGLISQTCGEVQLSNDDLISNVKWQ